MQKYFLKRGGSRVKLLTAAVAVFGGWSTLGEAEKYTCKYTWIYESSGVAQLTIYLDKKSGRLIERAAKQEALSLSRWAREKLLLAAGAPEWPKGYSTILGSVSDPSFRAPDEGENTRDQEAVFGQ